MKIKLIWVSVVFVAILYGCDNERRGETQVDGAGLHYPVEAYLSVDPSIALPAVRNAIKEKNGDVLLLTWILGASPESRKESLEYLLAPETEVADVYFERIDRIGRELEARKLEIDEVLRKLKQKRRN